MDEKNRIELEAAAFRGLVQHLQKRTDVQNIDLMNLAGFCRNCLSKWYLAAAELQDVEMDYDQARELLEPLSRRTRNNPYERALVYQMLGFVASSGDHYAEALGYFEKSLLE